MEDGQHLITASRNINLVCPKRSKQKLLNRQCHCKHFHYAGKSLVSTHALAEGGGGGH